jgi:hypothetical protein
VELNEFEPGRNPYETPISGKSALEPTAPTAVKKPGAHVGETLLLLFVVPAILSNAVFWGLIWLEPYLRWAGDQVGYFFFVVVPAIGLLYGILAGSILRFHLGIQNGFVHPIAQAIFQPFWFFVMLIGGCICAIPIFLMTA